MHKIAQHPSVTVLMSVYNGEKYLRAAIESILNQTYKDFEFLILNDASIDSSSNIILSYNDERIRLINNKENPKMLTDNSLLIDFYKRKNEDKTEIFEEYENSSNANSSLLSGISINS